jgi:hypothetical protein
MENESSPVSMAEAVATILQDMEQTQKTLRVMESALAAHFEKMLAKPLAVGSVVDANSVDSPAYHAKATPGRSFRPVYQILGPVRVKIDGGYPILSKWTALAISIDYDGVRTLGKPLELEGSVFPLQAVAQDSANADAYILRLVKRFEAQPPV